MAFAAVIIAVLETIADVDGSFFCAKEGGYWIKEFNAIFLFKGEGF